jgi:hypothetical protein
MRSGGSVPAVVSRFAVNVVTDSSVGMSSGDVISILRSAGPSHRCRLPGRLKTTHCGHPFGLAHPLLLRHEEPGCPQFVGQRVVINLFEEASTRRIQDLACGADDAPRQPVHLGIICVYLRASAVENSCGASRGSGLSLRRPVASSVLKIRQMKRLRWTDRCGPRRKHYS